ncbi:putative ATPase [Rhodococcus erythropolis]|uniref:ATP-dependent nuclease n=1 Tax=Rhodococcus TaxID=1827 RepID=UPI002169C393|nr:MULTISPECIES: ATP-binding protein [Rhodococcus]MCS4257386.1 putative ATPase [Rhodococcus erythropolis]MCW2425663.1 putative ATPase [Rhodococcus erythropolis]MDV8015374.1 ATP-binding protein [Rhodococcus sp. IEGM 1241]
MPGSKLSSTEKRLAKQWVTPTTDSADLKSISIESHEESTGLRGIYQVNIKFEYPISVLVGKNGTGKTTLLQLAALAYESPPKYGFSNYKFTDFFSVAYKEVPSTGFDIRWSFRGSEVDDIVAARRSTKKWMHYERRPHRAVRFIGISRISAPVESAAHRRAFSSESTETFDLDNTFKTHLSQILTTDYSRASTENSGRYDLSRFTSDTNSPYSGFNMGTGEGAIVQILNSLQKIPSQSIVVIEEVELGLHPSAAARLATVLTEIALSKNLQIITTSHSEWFIDALPREARIYLSRTASGRIQSFNGVTTRTAISGISGTSLPELHVICEDTIAEKIINTQLPANLRRRTRILTLGAKQILLQSAVTLSEAFPRVPILIVWDGDMTDKEISNSINSSQIEQTTGYKENLIDWLRLPSDTEAGHFENRNTDSQFLAPEVSIKRALLGDSDSLAISAELLKIETEELHSALASAILAKGSHHSLFYELSQTIALDESSIVDAIVRGYLVAIDHKSIDTKVSGILKGIRQGFQIPAKQE